MNIDKLRGLKSITLLIIIVVALGGFFVGGLFVLVWLASCLLFYLSRWLTSGFREDKKEGESYE
jgi:hypothetical protein